MDDIPEWTGHDMQTATHMNEERKGPWTGKKVPNVGPSTLT